MQPTESRLFALVRRVRPVAFGVLVAAHRGASQDAPENTLAAFSRAIEAGADLVEFDVHVSGSGDPVVIHDERVDRTTDGTGEVWRFPTAALRELDAGTWFSDAYAKERIPTLDETLDLMRRKVVPLIEVKVRRKRSADAGKRVISTLARHGMLEDAVVICRETARVREVHEASPATPLAYITYTKRQARGAARLPSVSGLDIYWKSLSLRLISELRARDGFFLTPWTVNRRSDQERLLAMGVESLITDCPRAFRDTIERFELSRQEDLLERFERTGEDVDLELEPAERGVKTPDDLAAEMGTASEADLE
jgi:glycerophosphoryl diester phosphodiesterase